MPKINHYLKTAKAYASKAISQAAKANPKILNLSIGEPAFGPPAHLLSDIVAQDLTLAGFIDASKRYEHSRGSPTLRQAIADWYQRCYRLKVNPECEVMVTHGGIEALSLAILAVTDPGDAVAITDPAYTLYARSISILGRQTTTLVRGTRVHNEYVDRLDGVGGGPSLTGVLALLVNSPENPTGYVASRQDWNAISAAATAVDAWVIHDEVYDTMAYQRPHIPARSVSGLEERAILVNSCSKKFGVPGLRIGWIVADSRVIEAATKAHDCLCLGVNIMFEQVAVRLLKDPSIESWCAGNHATIAARHVRALVELNEQAGYHWPRRPLGGMFLFPDVTLLYKRLPPAYRQNNADIGAAVTDYLLHEQMVAVVPGSVYGAACSHHIRLTTCGPSEVFDAALARLASVATKPPETA